MTVERGSPLAYQPEDQSGSESVGRRWEREQSLALRREIEDRGTS